MQQSCKEIVSLQWYKNKIKLYICGVNIQKHSSTLKTKAMNTIKTHNAPAFVRHLETLNKFTANPDAAVYPFDVWQQLVKLERRANRVTTAECNGTIDEETAEKRLNAIKAKVRALLPGLKTLFVNGDPRGYALKIKETEAKEIGLYQDWGGYGIIAPEF